MSETSKIRWTHSTWNPFAGCTQVSPGCANCYALELSERFRGSPAFPVGFDPVFKPHKLREPHRWKEPRRIFVNSMSDWAHEAFTDDQIDQLWQVMVDVPRHTYQLLTKRPEHMLRYVTGWLARTGRTAVPAHIWLGVTIENDRWTERADALRAIPVPVRFISAEPLLSDVPSLDLTDIGWVIIGGESGPAHIGCCSTPWTPDGPPRGRRCFDHRWGWTVLAEARRAGTATFFKQDSDRYTERRPWLVMPDGSHLTLEEYPA